MPRLSKIGAAALAAFGWTGLNTISASYLAVAGGGGGGGMIGGGGGAGGYQAGTTSLNPTLSYTVIVGAGGAGTTSAYVEGNQGSNSSFSTITANGGGKGGIQGSATDTSGGSSGGAGGFGTRTGTASQGNLGGTTGWSGAGGGGAGAVGADTPNSNVNGGAGGAGTANSITGTSVTYAGGGGGGSYRASGGAGGSGGGGAGGAFAGGIGVSGTANLGGGGGGGGDNSPGAGGAGGSGVVIISYVGAQQFGGGVVTSSGGNTIHTFTTSGTLSPLSSLTANYLIVAGGGGGGGGNGGGGAGGLLSGSNLTIDKNSIYAVTVGAGGTAAGASAGGNGGNSLFSMVSTTAVGGGGGGYQGGTTTGASGGSGGGGSYSGSAAGGTGTVGQGNNGGSGIFAAVQYGGGGGGGAGAVGANGTSTTGGNGGAGTASSISGSSVTYAGGGGGGTNTANAGSGGAGGGGAGGTNSGVGTAGTANTGGGGGGGATTGAANFSGGAGGSGVVIISYPGSTQQMAGGTVTVAGGNVIHTFTSSGYLAPIFSANNSLRFRSSVSAYLNRTPATASNRQTWTWSGWIKRGALSVNQAIFSASDGTQNNEFLIYFGTNDTITIQQTVGGTSAGQIACTTNAVFRDPSAWYHIVLAVDTTQATSTNRLLFYVNGVSQTFSLYSVGSSINTWVNNTNAHAIAKRSDASLYFDGYMDEINFIDGQALTPNSFGYYSDLGVWQPIRYGGSYGTNGFYLPFTGGSSYYGSFNGSSQYLQATLPATLTGAFTLEFYLYRSGTGNQFCFTLGDSNTSTGLEYYIGTTGTVNNVYSVSAQISTSSNVPVANAWNHVAITRDSSNVVRLFVNGVQAGSTWTTTAAFSSTLRMGVEFFSGSITGYVNGGLSNFRVINGTALYTSNFAPPTSALTAVSGTAILTLQSSTIIDNSGNSLSITNNGTVVTSQAYPFTMLGNQSKDYSPQGNNWTNNNIGVLAGSTLDIMTDVPTLTSATTANYCVLNPLRPFGGSLSNGNLTAVTGNTGSANSGVVTSTVWLPTSGKFYFEATPTTVGEIAIGLTTNSNISAALYYRGGDIYINGSVATTQASYTNNDVIGVAVDIGGATVQFYKNNAAQGTAQSISAITAPLVACLAQLSGGGSATANINFGQQPFAYTPPTGFVALNTFNLPTPTIGATASSQANKYMDVTLWTGDGTTNTRSFTNSGSMQPDWIWTKARSATWAHNIFDSVRGFANDKGLNSNLTDAEGTNRNGYVSAANSNGFSMANGTSGNQYYNENGTTYVGWQWRASNTTAVTNTAGSITSTVSANTTAGFSVVTWTGTNSNATVGHGLGVAPSMIILKPRNASDNWPVWHSSFAVNEYVYLNLTNAKTSLSTFMNSTLPSSTVISLGTWANVNTNTQTMVAYCFAPIAGYSAFGSYTGNGSTDGTFVYTGFRPRFVLIKRTNAAEGWEMFDSSRDTYNPEINLLEANVSSAEISSSTAAIDFLSNGFKQRNTRSATNGTSDTYIYACFAENPFKYANAR